MVSEWIERKLGDLFKVKHGFAFKGKYFSDTETFYLLTTPGNFSIGGGFQNDKPKYYSGPIPDDYVLNAGDIIVTMTDLSKESDTLGNAAIIPEDSNIWLHNQRVGLLQFNDSCKSYPKFVSYLLRSHEYRSWIIGSATGTTVKHTSPSRISEFACRVPPLAEQKAIAHILGALDDKIELNRRMNATLEAMAQALFKSWFVDFDPVLDNALTAGNPIPDDLEERAETRRQALANGTANRQTAVLFPATFHLTEDLGWIPAGWEMATLGDYLEIKRGGSPRPIHDFLRPEGLPWVKIADATASTSRFLFATKEFIKPEGLRKTVLKEKGSLILSNSATPGLPIFLELDACIHDGWLHFPKKRHFGNLYLYQLFLVIREELVAQGNGSVFTNLKTDILRAQTIVVPSSLVLELFEGWMKPTFEKILALNIQTQTLAKLRDTLLPKLISGELRLPDAQKLVEEALS